jgi:nitroreductase
MTQIDIIKTRVSCRTFENLPITQDLMDKMTEFIGSNINPPFGSKAEFQIIYTPDIKDKLKIGTYGFINGAQYFIIGKIKKGQRDLEDYGYLMEKIILYATSLSLGACWLGGTFTKDSIIKIINLTDDETCPAISPLGYKAEKRGLLEQSLRKMAGSDNRIPFTELFFEESLDTPLVHDNSNPYIIPLEMVRLAPSASNKQPWRIIKEIGKNIFHFYIIRPNNYEKTKGVSILTKLLKVADLQRVDIGIAMSHFEISCNELGLNGHWEESSTNKIINGAQYIVTWQG